MNRREFIESCRDLSEAELLEIAVRARTMAEKRVPEEMKPLIMQGRTWSTLATEQCSLL